MGVPLATVEAVSHTLCDVLTGGGEVEQKLQAGS